MKFFKNENGENLALLLKSGKTEAALDACLKEVSANTTDAAVEKHVPVVTVDGDKVTVAVGSVEHPMQEEHFITFIALETRKGIQIVNLEPGEKPAAEFIVAQGDAPVAAYEFCNLHGLWKSDI